MAEPPSCLWTLANIEPEPCSEKQPQAAQGPLPLDVPSLAALAEEHRVCPAPGVARACQNERMARKPTLSPTKFTTYLACPVRYRWTFVDPRGRAYLRSKAYFSFGLSLHKTLEEFAKAGQDGAPVREQLLSSFDDNWVQAGFRSEEEMAEAYGEARDILERMAEDEAMPVVANRTLYVEKQLHLDFEHFRLVGRIDRIGEDADGTLEVLDYKSGREGVTSQEVADDLAMGIYQLLVKRTWPERSVRATIYALRSGEHASSSMDDEGLALLEADLEKLGNEIVTQEFFELTPRPKALCGGCDFLKLCQKHPDFDWQSS